MRIHTRCLIWFAAALLLCGMRAPSAAAQSGLRVSSGVAVPLAPDLFTRASAPGLSIEIGPEFVLMDRFYLAVIGRHARFPLADQSVLEASVTTAWSASVQVAVPLLAPSSPMQLYPIVGAGVTRLNHRPERVVIVCAGVIGPCPPVYVRGADDPQVRVRIHGGIGASVRLTPRLGVFAESTYAGLMGGNALQYVPVQLGLRVAPFPQ